LTLALSTSAWLNLYNLYEAGRLVIIVAVLCEHAMTLVVLPLVVLVVDARHLGGSRGAYAWLLAAALRKLSATVLAIARLPCAPMFKSIVMSLLRDLPTLHRARRKEVRALARERVAVCRAATYAHPRAEPGGALPADAPGRAPVLGARRTPGGTRV